MDEELDALDDLYPGGYLDHFIAMLGGNHDQINDEIIQDHCKQYIAFEGKEEFENLRSEVREVKSNNHQNLFIQLAKYYELDQIELETLNRVFSIIEKTE